MLLSSPDVTHIACAFDHVIESYRNDLFDGYKTGEGTDPDLLALVGDSADGIPGIPA
jgi:5'-3' exonuclease